MADIDVPVNINTLLVAPVKRLKDMGGYWAEVVYALGGGGGGGGGGGATGAVTIANGDDIAEGSVGDTAYSGTGSGTVISLLKGIFGKLAQVVNVSGRLNVDVLTDVTQGTTADTDYTGTGSAGVIAILKGLYTKLAGTLTATVTGTVNAVITNSSPLSVTVSNLLNPQPVSEANGANVALGTTTEGTWNASSPANSGTVISLLKTQLFVFLDTTRNGSQSAFQWLSGVGMVEFLSKASTYRYLISGPAIGESIGTTPTHINIGSPLPSSGFLLKANPANTADLFISHVSGSGSGFPLSAGEGIFLPCNLSTDFWVRAVSGTQTIYWMGARD